MKTTTRRDVLGGMGSGMLFLGLGPALAAEVRLGPTNRPRGVFRGDELSFGELEPLVAMMQESAPDSLLPMLVQELHRGTTLRTLVAAGALANARTFGGQNYNGYHAFMALVPALEMSARLPRSQAPLPVLKVLYRNSTFIQETGGRSNEALQHISPEAIAARAPAGADGRSVREALRKCEIDAAEHSFASIAKSPPAKAFDELQTVIHEDIDVHRIVLAWRVWDMLSLVGDENAHTMLRQSVRHCVSVEKRRVQRGIREPSLRKVLPRLMEEYALGDGPPAGGKQPEDSYLEELGLAIFSAGRDQGAERMAAALAEGFDPEALGEALTLAGNRLLLSDPGRSRGEKGKPVGSVHGASVGVHASDAARAWRNVARVVAPRNEAASLIVGAYHAAGQSDRVDKHVFEYEEQLDAIDATDPKTLRSELSEAIRGRDQALAMAIVNRYEVLGGVAQELFGTLLTHSVDADGALHAEKYFATVCEDHASSRAAFKWRHLQGLARVCASEAGYEAPGLAHARELLKG